MNYKVKGTITSIGEKKTLENGSVVLDYVVEEKSENGYVTPFSINMYNKAEYAEHVVNFIEYNKIGDEVEVEFTIRGNQYNGRVYNSLSHWRCDKVGAAKVESNNEDGLPF